MANWAWIIGINEYRNLQSLQYAVADAAAMRDYCKDAKFDRIFYFADHSPGFTATDGSWQETQPTFGTLISFLEDFFAAQSLGDGDNFWFFFSGHGLRHGGHDYFLPSDANPRNVERTGIPVYELTERLRAVGADNVILLLDACRDLSDHSGYGIGDEAHQGVITLYSCAPSEKSYEIEDLGRGAFTAALLETFETPNCATVEKFCRQITYRVPQLNRQYGKPGQRPIARVEPNTKNYWILLPKLATDQDLSRMRECAFEAEADRDLLEAKRLWWRVLSIDPSDSRARTRYEEVVLTLGMGQCTKPKPQARQRETRVARPKSAKIRTARSVSSSLAWSLPKISRRDVLYFSGVVSAALSIAFARWVDGIRRSGETSIEPEPETPQPPPSPKQTPATMPQTPSGDSSQGSQIFDLGNGVTLEMVAISGGTFIMGAPESEAESRDRERPQHEVTVPAFWMGKYEVTQAQYEAVVGENPAQFRGSNRPVEKVSWNKAQTFCQKLSTQTGQKFRLPSEAEWEYACRAGTTTPFYSGETITTDQANYDGNSTYGNEPKGKYREQTTDVGSFPPNAWGLYDLHGNVWEWCEDVVHESYEGAPTDGSAWLAGYENDNRFPVLRGGSWLDFPGACRSAFRFFYSRDLSVGNVGFRIVCDPPRALLGA
ncbi:MAG: SUMF1/EgtB/PvdO family nonheme iron enzyme [Cyanobacteria bacterium P01_G01_bin.54]